MSDEVTPQTSIGFGHGAFGIGPYVAQVLTAALALAQAPQTLAAAGTITTVGSSGQLNLPQAPQTVVASGTLQVGAALALTQADQALAAAATVIPLLGQLSLTQDDQTLHAAGGALVVGTLVQVQAPQTLVAFGGVAVVGTLSAQQAAQTLAGHGVVVTGIAASLNLTQAPDSLQAGAALGVVQDDQTLVAAGQAYWYAAPPCEMGEWPAAPPCETGAWVPWLEPSAPAGFGRYGYGMGPFGNTPAQTGNSMWVPANDCSAAAWTPVAIGSPGTWSKAA